MTNKANTKAAQKLMTELVRNHESYIRTAGPIARGDYGDVEYAEWELLESASNAELLDEWDFNYETPWFVALVKRQARCNFYQSCD